MIDIYKITNKINKTPYIGQSPDVYRRWKMHCYRAKKEKPKLFFHCAIKKYKPENFKVETLGFCLSKRAANIAEKALIEYWRSKGLVYNIADGGDGGATRPKGFHLSDEHKRKLSVNHVGMKGRHLTKEHKLKLSNLRGWHHTEEAKRKISVANRGLCRTKETMKKMSNIKKRWWKEKRKV